MDERPAAAPGNTGPIPTKPELDKSAGTVWRGEERFRLAQNRGLRLAVLCRTIAGLVACIWYFAAIAATNQEARIWTVSALFLFIAVGIAHLSVIGTRYDRWWMKYLLYTIDVFTMCALFVLIPVSRADDVPQIIAFRAYGIYYFFPVIALAVLSLSWQLVLWSGAMVVFGWWAAFLWVISQMERTLSWADIPADATRTDYELTFLSIDFIGRGNRVEETGLLFIAAAILSVAVWRARDVFFSQMKAEQKHQEERAERKRVEDTFGQFVPPVVLDQLVASGGKIPSKKSNGAVLVLDIEGFTGFAADHSPSEVIATLDEFLSDAADRIGARQGVVISYTGDGLLASFNAPLEIEQPELMATNAAIDLADLAANSGFRARIGLAAGELVSGSIGSRSRMAFTVYGATVNRASRLETLCKKLVRSILVDGAMARAIEPTYALEPMGEVELRGSKRAEPVFALPTEAGSRSRTGKG